MIHHRTKKQVRSFDIFKLITTVILLLIILYTWRSCSNLTPEETSTGPATPQAIVDAEQTQAEETTTATPLPTPTLEPTPTETSIPPVSETPTVTPPTLTMPGGAVSPGEVTLSGTGDPGSEVEIVANGQVVGTATVGSDGNWQTEVELPDAGEYTLQVRTVDSGGAILAEAQPADLVVEAPTEETTTEAEVPPPTLTMPAGAVSPGEVTLNGTGDPGSEVEIIVGGQVVGTATVGSDGSWQTEIELPDEGEYEVQVRAADSGGVTLAESQSASLVVEPPAEETTTEVEIITPTLTMPAGAVSPGEVTLSGKGDPGDELEIVADGQVVGTATVDSDGSWQTEVELPQVGEYGLQVRAVDRRGRVLAESLSERLNVNESTPPVATPTTATDQAYIVQADDWLSKLADKFYGDIFAYPAIVTATNNKAAEDNSFTVITDPNVIEVGQKLWIPASP